MGKIKVICTITDFACAIIPTFVIHKLQMDRKAKIALCCVLGLAIFPGKLSEFLLEFAISDLRLRYMFHF